MENMIGNTTNVGYPCHVTKSLILVKQNKGGETPYKNSNPIDVQKIFKNLEIAFMAS
jgi:hypothetical protein